MKLTNVILAALLCLSGAALSADAQAAGHRQADAQAAGQKQADAKAAGQQPANDDATTEAIEAQAAQLIAEGGRVSSDEAKAAAASIEDQAVQAAADASAKTADAAKPKTELKESEIPVLTETPKQAKSEGGFMWRLLASMGILAVVAGALIFASKRYTKGKNVGGQKTRIEIVHQLHLGPKRSVALLRVAGEVILVGITDHNINMMKSIALIDDELENALGPKDFNGFLDDEFEMEDVRKIVSPRA